MAAASNFDKGKTYGCSNGGCRSQPLITDIWRCNDCDSAFICSTCIVKEHRSHQVEEVNSILEKRKEQLDEWRQQIETAVRTIDNKHRQIVDDVRVAKDQGAQIFAALTKFGPKFEVGMNRLQIERDALYESVNADPCELLASGRLDSHLDEARKNLDAYAAKHRLLETDTISVLENLQNVNDLLGQILPRMCETVGDDGNVGSRQEEEILKDDESRLAAVVEVEPAVVQSDDGGLAAASSSENNENVVSTQENGINNFDGMGLKNDLLRGIYGCGFEKPTTIQQRVLVPCCQPKDVIVEAPCTEGRMSSAAIAILQKIDTSVGKGQAIIVTPDQHKANYIRQMLWALGKYMNVGVQLCLRHSLKPVFASTHIIVGTHMGVHHAISSSQQSFGHMKVLVLDRADEMISLGYEHSLLQLKALFRNIQVIFVTAALVPPRVLDVARRMVSHPLHLVVGHEELSLQGVRQFYVEVKEESDSKLRYLSELVRQIRVPKTVVYCKDESVEAVAAKLIDQKFSLRTIHSGMSLVAREISLRRFWLEQLPLLVVSESAASTKDVQLASVVINFDLPSRENYIYCVGRNGRFLRKCFAISFVTNDCKNGLKDIQKFYGTTIAKMTNQSGDVKR